MPESIHEFYAVTLNPTSIFKVTDRRDADNCPVVFCMASRRMGVTPPRFGLHGGTLVAVTKKGIIIYREPYFHSSDAGPQPPTPIEQVSPAYHGDRTNDVVALFPANMNGEHDLGFAQAMSCFHALRLVRLDPRWKEDTLETLARIGEFHPVFRLSRSTEHSFTY